jgi:hypothetical protein
MPILIFCGLAFLSGASGSGTKKPQKPRNVGCVAGLTPTAGKAIVYVYRKREREDGIAPLIFANGDFVAKMGDPTCVQVEVPQGAVEFTTTGSHFSGLGFPLPGRLFLGQSDCSGLDWSHLTEAKREDVARCEADFPIALRGAPVVPVTGWLYRGVNGEQMNRRADGYLEMYDPTFNVPAALREVPRSGLCGVWSEDYLRYKGFDQTDCRVMIDAAQSLIDFASSGKFIWEDTYYSPAAVLTRFRDHTRFEDLGGFRLKMVLEAGKAYYVRWSFTFSGGKMTVVDEATGTNEMKDLPAPAFY